jgi:hypothetical protein
VYIFGGDDLKAGRGTWTYNGTAFCKNNNNLLKKNTHIQPIKAKPNGYLSVTLQSDFIVVVGVIERANGVCIICIVRNNIILLCIASDIL